MKRWNAPLSVVFVLCLMSAAIVDAEVVGVIHEGTGDTEHLARIDPSTGSLSLLPGIANCCFVASGVSAVDEAGARLFFVGRIMNDPGETDNRIFTVDINTGAVLSNPTLTTGYNYNFLEFDPSSGTLYAVAYNADLASSSGGTTKQEELLTINTTTGAATTVGSGIDQCCWVSSGSSGFDSRNGVFYFLGAKFTDSSSQRRLFSVDASTGSVLDSPLVDGGSTTYNHNFMEFSETVIFSDGLENGQSDEWSATVP